jgi:CheY-like chemotaxis protein
MPMLPNIPFDEAVFVANDLIGVKRRNSWSIPPLRKAAEFHVLVVNDVRDIADFASWTLERWGFSTSTAYDGIAGLEAAKRLLPDLILLNWQMPGLDGLSVLKLLRSDPRTAHIKVIMDSGYPPIAEMAASFGAQDFIPLPYDLRVLFGKVAMVLRS